ncbi:hypothetical protein DLAC_08550 [Tieghemostelium lacteum]|uniref:ADF-H domain-containing protein n=1 Tax=Tieghemostelium lacteum TaxID=361077 RepID=A0A151Z7N7_TIELA|nr:hypothetical protein DLAC_08550 [Tieghemostelium lacteum]|eukprot:KYQ89979.1 hypothetical protein DLAC_08550 [Tieghemostelium lacteum]
MNNIVQTIFLDTISKNNWTIFDEIFNVIKTGVDINELNSQLTNHASYHIILQSEMPGIQKENQFSSKNSKYIYSFWEGSKMNKEAKLNFQNTTFQILSVLMKFVKVENVFQICQKYYSLETLYADIKNYSFQWSTDQFVYSTCNIKKSHWVQFEMDKSSAKLYKVFKGYGDRVLMENLPETQSSITFYKNSELDYQFIIWEGQKSSILNTVKFMQFKLFVYLNLFEFQNHLKVLKFNNLVDFQMMWKVYEGNQINIQLNHVEIPPKANHLKVSSSFIQSNSQPSVLSIINRLHSFNNTTPQEPIKSTNHIYSIKSKSSDSSPILFKKLDGFDKPSGTKSDNNSPIETNFIKTLMKSPTSKPLAVQKLQDKFTKSQEIPKVVSPVVESEESSPEIASPSPVKSPEPESIKREEILSYCYNVPFINMEDEIQEACEEFNKKKINWILLGYTSGKAIGLVGKGSNGFNEMKSHLNNNSTLYGIVQCIYKDIIESVGSDGSTNLNCSQEIEPVIPSPLGNSLNSIPNSLSSNGYEFHHSNKNLLLHWFGNKSSALEKARRGDHIAGVSSMFKQLTLVHGEYETDDIQDLSDDQILQKLTSFRSDIKYKKTPQPKPISLKN